MCNPSSWCQHAISELSLLVHNTTFFTSQIAWDNFISNKKQPFLMLTIRTYVWHNDIFWFLWGIWRTIVYTLFQLSLKNYIFWELHMWSELSVYEVQSVVMGIYQDNPNGLVVNSWSFACGVTSGSGATRNAGKWTKLGLPIYIHVIYVI